MNRRDLYPTVSVRKTAAKYRHLDSYLTDTDLDGIPRLTDRQRKRLLRAVTFRRNVENRNLAYAKRHQYQESAPAETVEILGASLGAKRPGIDAVNMTSYRLVNATKATVYDRAEPALNQHDARPYDDRPLEPTARKLVHALVACGELDKLHLDTPFGNVNRERPITDVPDAGPRYDGQQSEMNWTPELERRRAIARSKAK